MSSRRRRSSTLEPAQAEAIDALIRRRFQSCESLPLFPDPSPAPPPRGFFQPGDVGRQLRLGDLLPPARRPRE